MASKFKHRVKLVAFPHIQGSSTTCVAFLDFPDAVETKKESYIWVRLDRMVAFRKFISSCNSYKIVYSYETFKPNHIFDFPMRVVSGVEFRFRCQNDASMFKLGFA